MSIFSVIQDHQDALISRFCSPKRRVYAKTEWYGEDVDYANMEKECLEQIIFYEARGYYLFQEPVVEHEPHGNRLRVVLTFKPTESNQ